MIKKRDGKTISGESIPDQERLKEERMKIQKVIGLTLLILSILTAGGIFLMPKRHLWLMERQSQYTVENQAGKETCMQSVDVMADGGERQQGTFKSSVQNDTDTPLMDGEDYSVAPADNGLPYYVKVNRQENVVTVYALDDEGYYTKPVKAMVCSVGRNQATPTGTFVTGDKYEWRSLVGGVYGQYAYRINGPIMFHSVPYYTMNKGSLETEEFNKLGEAASLGCVRLSVLDAKWIYDNCPRGTIVTIYDDDYAGPLGKPVAEKLDSDDERSSWDPTDPDVNNPWHEEGPRILGTGTRVLERGWSYSVSSGIVAVDRDGNDLTDQITIEGTVDIMTVGDYRITYSVEDAQGRTAEATALFRVQDTIAPEIVFDDATITLNHVEASEVNCMSSILSHFQATDSGQVLPSDCLQADVSSLEGKTGGSFPVTVVATDASGNVSEPVEILVHLDRQAPLIREPLRKQFTAVTEQDLRDQLAEAIPVEDHESGVEQVRISWVWESDTDTYTVLVTAKDRYGNVSSKFLYNFMFSYQSNE